MPGTKCVAQHRSGRVESAAEIVVGIERRCRATRRVLPGFGGIIGAELRVASAFRLRWDYSLVNYTRVGATISGGVALSPPTEISVRPVVHAMRVGLIAGF